jgi:hypothetical protein
MDGGHSMHGDHSSPPVDSSSHVFGGGMKMWFYFSTDEVVLFRFWQVQSVWGKYTRACTDRTFVCAHWAGIIVSAIGIALLAIVYEGIKWSRARMQKWHERRLLDGVSTTATQSASRNDTDKNNVHATGSNNRITYVYARTSPSLRAAVSITRSYGALWNRHCTVCKYCCLTCSC